MYIDPNNIPAGEGTIYTPQDQNFQQPVNQEFAPVEPEYYQEAAPEQEKKSSGAWKGVLIGGVPGIALGVAGAIFAPSLLAGEPNADDNQAGVATTPGDAPIYEEAPVSYEVNDEMSFGEAFAAAREDVGPGGVFEWHGQVYSTYTAEEWNALTPEQQHDYSQSLHNAGVTGDEPISGEESDLDNPEEVANAEVNDPEEVANSDVDDPDGHVDNPVGDPDAPVVISSDDILGGEVVIDETGYYENEDGSLSQLAVGSVDGNAAVFVDVDNDGIVDGVLVDADNDGEISDNEIVDLSDSGLTMDDLSAQMSGTDDQVDDIYGQTDDYINDGDTTTLC